MKEKCASFQMSQELCPKSYSFVGAFKKPRNIRNRIYVFLLSDLHYPQRRFHSGEGIVCNLGFGIGYPLQERGFSGIGKASETHIRHQLQGKRHPMLIPCVPELRKSRSATVAGMLTSHQRAVALRDLRSSGTQGISIG